MLHAHFGRAQVTHLTHGVRTACSDAAQSRASISMLSRIGTSSTSAAAAPRPRLAAGARLATGARLACAKHRWAERSGDKSVNDHLCSRSGRQLLRDSEGSLPQEAIELAFRQHADLRQSLTTTLSRDVLTATAVRSAGKASHAQAAKDRRTFAGACAGFEAAAAVALLCRPGFLAGGVRGPSVEVAAPVRPDFRGGLRTQTAPLAA